MHDHVLNDYLYCTGGSTYRALQGMLVTLRLTRHAPTDSPCTTSQHRSPFLILRNKTTHTFFSPPFYKGSINQKENPRSLLFGFSL
jgi:hypothetical protein